MKNSGDNDSADTSDSADNAHTRSTGVSGVSSVSFTPLTPDDYLSYCVDIQKVDSVSGVSGVSAIDGVGTIDTPRPSAPLGDDARRVHQWFLDTKAAGWLTCRELAMNTGMDIGRVQSAATELNSHKVALFMNDAVRVPPVEVRP